MDADAVKVPSSIRVPFYHAAGYGKQNELSSMPVRDPARLSAGTQ